MRVFGTDLDGCLADIDRVLQERISNKFGIEPHPDRLGEFYMHKRFDYPEEAIEEFIRSDECFADPHFWLSADPIEENIMEIHGWVLNHGAVPSIITARHPEERIGTEAWLAKFKVPYSNALFGTKNNKHIAATWTCCDFMIEDRYEEALTIHLATDITSYILRTKYNEHQQAEYDHGVRTGKINPDKLVWVDNYKQITEREFSA